MKSEVPFKPIVNTINNHDVDDINDDDSDQDHFDIFSELITMNPIDDAFPLE